MSAAAAFFEEVGFRYGLALARGLRRVEVVPIPRRRRAPAVREVRVPVGVSTAPVPAPEPAPDSPTLEAAQSAAPHRREVVIQPLPVLELPAGMVWAKARVPERTSMAADLAAQDVERKALLERQVRAEVEGERRAREQQIRRRLDTLAKKKGGAA